MDGQVLDLWTQRAILSAVLILVGKIVWDWLSNRREAPAEPVKVQCEEPDSCGTVHAMRENQVRVEEAIKGITADLKEGDKKFDKMQISVGKIEKDMAVVFFTVTLRHI